MLDSLATQASGAGNHERLGALLMRSMVIAMIACIPVAATWWFAEDILDALHQNPATAKLAGLYVRVLLPSMIPYILFWGLTKWLQAQVSGGQFGSACEASDTAHSRTVHCVTRGPDNHDAVVGCGHCC